MLESRRIVMRAPNSVNGPTMGGKEHVVGVCVGGGDGVVVVVIGGESGVEGVGGW